MKLIQSYNDINEANKLVALLEEVGIPSRVSENGLQNRGTHIPEGNEVWIYINSQHNDAINFIKDNTYTIKNPVDIAEFYNDIESIEAKETLNKLKNTFIKYGVVSIIIILTVAAVFINAKT